jgi:hypothetical protein
LYCLFGCLMLNLELKELRPSSETPKTNRRRQDSRETRMDGRVRIGGVSFD